MELFLKEIVLALLGLRFTLKIMLHLYDCFVYFTKCHLTGWIWGVDLAKTYGPWAVVTGASSGIGLGIVKQLAKDGLNVVLVSRGHERLSQLANDIAREYGVKTKAVVMEATDRSSYNHVLQQIDHLDIGILVNNVAIIAEERTEALMFHESKPARVYHMNTVNNGAATVMMRGILQHMKKRNRGLIVNVSSIATYEPIAYQALYSANKKYLDTLTESIRDEIKSTGVKIKSVRPFVVRTKMTSINHIAYNNNIVTQSPEEYADHVVPTFSNDLSTCGYWFADLLIWPYNLMPDWYRRIHVTAIMTAGIKYGKLVPTEKLK